MKYYFSLMIVMVQKLRSCNAVFVPKTFLRLFKKDSPPAGPGFPTSSHTRALAGAGGLWGTTGCRTLEEAGGLPKKNAAEAPNDQEGKYIFIFRFLKIFSSRVV
jgi:hypothetical protein